MIGYAFSVDIEHLFYSVPHRELFEAVRLRIDENGVITFQNTAGVTVDNFLNWLEAYFHSRFIAFNNKLFLQNRGICIGSCVARIICNIFLAAINRTLEQASKLLIVLKFFDT